jgi:hypothetical protein
MLLICTAPTAPPAFVPEHLKSATTTGLCTPRYPLWHWWITLTSRHGSNILISVRTVLQVLFDFDVILGVTSH